MPDALFFFDNNGKCIWTNEPGRKLIGINNNDYDTVKDNLLFLFEAVVKIRVQGFSAYWADGWNRFDFILVMLALPSCANIIGTDLPGTNILLSLRTMRVFKSFRLLRFVPNIDSLLNGVKLAFKASYIVAIGMAVLLLIFSIITTFLFGRVAPQYFGNPALSVYSIFRPPFSPRPERLSPMRSFF